VNAGRIGSSIRRGAPGQLTTPARGDGAGRGREHQAVPVRDDPRVPARTGARALFDEQELAALVIDPRLAEVDDDLQREDQIAVEIAVQRIPVAACTSAGWLWTCLPAS